MTDCKEMRIKLIPDLSTAKISNKGKEERDAYNFLKAITFFFPAQNYIASQKAIHTTTTTKTSI